MPSIADVFLNNRADHLTPDSIFSQFIVPPFFKRISIFSDMRSVRILGGRGCGKTMFIRYFGHGSSLNPARSNVPESELQAIGLYLRPDTGFCGLMTADWLGKQRAKLAFSHYVALNLLIDACRSVQSIRNARFEAGPITLEDPDLSLALTAQLKLPIYHVSELEVALQIKLAEFESWVRNPTQCQEPVFASFPSLIEQFAIDLTSASPRLSKLSFRAFIDEFENLPSDLREVICDAIKHPSQRMAVHIAQKKHAVVDFKTSSDERVVEVHDLTTIDLELELSSPGEFELLAAELFLLRVREADVQFDCPLFKPEFLHDTRHLEHRLSKEYRKQVLDCVQEILPSSTAIEIAAMVLRDSSLNKRLRDMIQKGLDFQKLSESITVDELISEAHPQASIVLGALLNRRSQDGKRLVEQFHISIKSARPDNDPFFKTGGWIDNNLYGCLFHLYAGLPRRPNILYAGFDRFRIMASPNLRFFQALCHTALLLEFERKSGREVSGPFRVSQETQAMAAKNVSDKLFRDILQLGGRGVELLEITGRLGRIFEAFNRRRSQSEPEVNHFSIDNADRSNLSPQAELLLREAKIWSVIYEAKDTKNKSDYDIAQSDLILNPIYAPHFSISYRKRRKVTVSAPMANVLLCQSTEQYESILKQLVDPSDHDSSESMSLF